MGDVNFEKQVSEAARLGPPWQELVGLINLMDGNLLCFFLLNFWDGHC
jgi:hypothetical protein